ncbi:glycosyltransferase [Planctomycetota bacterium]|nr:glycosyltransferase [Planctomycetota bacterium]
MDSLSTRKIAAVVLAYNSSRDLRTCLEGLAAQRGVNLAIIVVDNNSSNHERVEQLQIARQCLPSLVLSQGAAPTEVSPAEPVHVYHVNETNGGYSAGNNVGLRLAGQMACEAALIVNPDMVLADADYVATLDAALQSDPKAAIACSSISRLDGGEDNPMVELSLRQELLLPISLCLRGLSPTGSPEVVQAGIVEVEKVSGCCFLIELAFIQAQGWFDESVFLYCEESILRAQVKRADRKMVMDSNLRALHAHVSSEKGAAVARVAHWSRSRAHYHRSYSGYSVFVRGLLACSRAIYVLAFRVRALLVSNE